MEEPRMGAGRNFYRIGLLNMKKLLLIFMLFIFFVPFLFGQNYPLLSPDFPIEEERNEGYEEQRIKINTIIMYWETNPAVSARQAITAGERITLTLRANNWYSQQPLPAFFMPPVPQGIILFPSALSAEERAKGIAVIFKIIPLAAGDIVLPARTLLYENTQFQIPALNIRVNSK